MSPLLPPFHKSTRTNLSIYRTTNTTSYERPTRLKGKSDDIKWIELLEKFKAVQERARRQQMQYNVRTSTTQSTMSTSGTGATSAILSPSRALTPAGSATNAAGANATKPAPGRGGLAGIGRLAQGRRVKK